MTNDIEGKVRSELVGLFKTGYLKGLNQGIGTKDDGSYAINLTLSSILSLTDKPELDKKEIVKILAVTDDLRPGEILEDYWDRIAEAIVSKLSKPISKAELDEKEVAFELYCLEFLTVPREELKDDWDGFSSMFKDKYFKKACILCSRFSKPVIKYPEKKECALHKSKFVDSKFCPQCAEAIGYNKHEDDMRKLNGGGE